jgi:multiple sugar transport system substrate-binding protein
MPERKESPQQTRTNGRHPIRSLRWPLMFLVGILALATTASAQKETTLTVWEYFSIKSQVKELHDLAALFRKTHPNVKVNFVFVPYNQLDNKLVASAVAKTGPDVVLYNPPGIGSLVSAGALANMTSDWSSFAAASQFPAGTVHKVNGKVYGVQGYVNLLGLYYNKDILNKVGITSPPNTTSELTADLSKVVAAGYKGITLTGQSNDQGEWQAFPWLSDSGWTYAKPQVATCKPAFNLAATWIKGKALSPIAATWGQVQPFQSFLVGKTAFAENGNWELDAAKSKAKFSYGVTQMPTGSGASRVYLGGEAESIGAFSKHKALAWQFLKDTYFSKAGELIAMKDVGSIPARADAAQTPAVTNDAMLKPFAKEVQQRGQAYPPNVATVNQVRNAELKVAQQWSAVIAGQTTPASACRSAVKGVEKALGN